MLLWLIRFFRGWVTFSINGRFPERFINLSLKNGIGIFDTVPVNGKLTASVIVSDYRCIRSVAHRSGVRLRIISRHGVPFFLHQNRNRWGLAAGAVLFVFVLMFLQSFVWTVELRGVETISKTALTQSLESYGLSVGKFRHNLDLHKIERQLQLEYKEIGWMSINLVGTRAEVEIKEKALVPETKYSEQYSNIKATADGIILSSDIRRGTAQVAVGSAVSKGQLLVGGMYENALGELHYVDADADIIAKTSYRFDAFCKSEKTSLIPLEQTTRKSLSVLWADFPITFSPQHSPFSSYTETKQVYLSDNPIPVALSTQHMVPFISETRTLTPREAEKSLMAELALFKLFGISDVLTFSENTEITASKGGYTLTADFECTENIAVKEKLIVNTE